MKTSKWWMIVGILTCAILVFGAVSAWATDYYVRTDGNDGNDGLTNNAAGAWLTINKGTCSSSPLVSGDILHVADGTYNLTGRIYVQKAGITVTGNTTNPENVIVQYSPVTNSLIFDMRANNVTVEGIKTISGKDGFFFDQSATGCTMSHCIIENTYQSGIYIYNGSGHTIEYTTITNPGQMDDLNYSNGIKTRAATTTVDQCTITSDKVKHMKWGINLEAGSNHIVTETTITGAWQAAIRVASGVKPVTITNNDIDDATEGYDSEAAISLDGNNDGSTISANHIDNIIASSAIKVYPAWNITISDNQIGVDDPLNDVRLEGICVSGCGGSGGNRVEITGNTIHNTGFAAVLLINSDNAYVYNNTITKCNNYGADNTGDWDYASIHVDENTDNAIVDNNTVSDGINGIQVWGSSCTVTNNTIYNMGLSYADTKVTADGTYYNSGIIVGTNWLTNNNKPTGTTITSNSIHDNHWGLYVRDYATLSTGDPSVLSVTAEENWWGDASGPGSAGPGSGDDVSVTVDYSPWWGANYVGAAHPWTWYTNDSIQDAIDAATAGDTINVADGTYTITDAVDVNKEITITGNTGSPSSVVVTYGSASQTLDCFDMQANDITVQGIKVVNGRYGFNFAASDPTGCTISNCVIDHAYEGAINIDGGSGHTISNNTITSCLTSGTKRGVIHIYGCPDTIIDGNTLTGNGLTGNHATMGIYVKFTYPSSSSERVEVINNNISGMLGINADIQIYDAPYTYIYNNTISNSEDKGIAIFGIYGNPAYTSTDNRVEVIGNNISSTYYPGMQAANSPYTYFYNNTLTKCNYYGGDGTGDFDYASIHIDSGSANCLIDSNTVSDGINGIQIWSDNCTVTNNTIYNMGHTYADTKVTGDGTYYNSGIIVGSNWNNNNIKPTGTTITGNDIHDNYHGLYVRDYATLSLADPDPLNVTAEENYWGAADGPGGAGPGSGDDVSVTVDYSPWWGANYVGDLHTTAWTWGTDDSIQDAIDAASAGDTINVLDGTYAAVVINKDLTLQAGSSPVIEGEVNGVTISDGTVTITGFTIRLCSNGIVVSGGAGHQFNENYIYDNDVAGVWNETGSVVDATDNWWGYATGPYHPIENPDGQGNRVSDNVLFDPWRTDPDIPGTTDRAYHDFPDTGWNLVSVPLDPMTPANGASVFDEVDSINQRLYRYNGATYDSGGTLPVKPEYGFWLYLSDPVVIDVAGTDVTPAAGNYYSTAVNFASGWQQIGVPFSTYWEDTMVIKGAEERTLGNAISGTPQWLGSNIYWWDAANQEYRWKGYDPSDPSELYMQPWDGYWIQNKSGGNLGFKFLYEAPIPPCSAMAMKQAALWRPLSELEPGASRPPAPPMMPQAAAVAQNIAVMVAPNPVQQGTAVEFRVTGQMASFVSSVTVQVYTVGGQLVFDESSQGQAVTWNLTTLSGEPVANGLYLYVAQMEFVGGETAKFNKLLILK